MARIGARGARHHRGLSCFVLVADFHWETVDLKPRIVIFLVDNPFLFMKIEVLNISLLRFIPFFQEAGLEGRRSKAGSSARWLSGASRYLIMFSRGYILIISNKEDFIFISISFVIFESLDYS